ncbi:hypothetical protein CPB86DRAFT_817037 [Serendipita vermifera]|nr:hypothetical protein CPB86DRAFT_817037 [Serendipita vermifera]
MSSSVPFTSEACLQIPAVESSYQPKGSYVSLGEYDQVYKVGEKSSFAIIAIYDVFGFSSQSEQGADILSETLGCQVFMPDFFRGDPVTNKGLARLLKADGVQKIGAYGLCWGERIATVAGINAGLDEGSAPLFNAVASIHPGIACRGDPQSNKRITLDDVEKVTVPTALYASNGEPIDVYKELVEALDKLPFSSKNAYRYYEKMHHGWAAARADLDNEENRKEFGDVYSRLASFFKNVM